MLLAGDLGGTKTNLAVYSTAAGLQAPLVEATFASAQYASLEALVGEFMSRLDVRPDRACFGVAGPVVAGQAHITNLPWIMSEDALAASLGLRTVRLINDLDAIAHAVPLLERADLHTLNQGKPLPGGAIGVIAPGTGLGEAFLIWNGERYQPHPSEGGHADFAPTSPVEVDLLRYLQERHGHVSFERVCSGHGLPNIYAFLRDSGRAPEPPWLAEHLTSAVDPAPTIVNLALQPDAPALCAQTLDVFVSILGAEAGNLALKVMATGGLYVGGGIPPRIVAALERGAFMQSFSRKGRFTDLLSAVPVHVILTPKAALLGAARHGFEENTVATDGGR
jgi:glucokinase